MAMRSYAGSLQTPDQLTKPARVLVDLVGIEPTTSSMPWKRAPSCATGPLFEDTTTSCSLRTTTGILADRVKIVNARDLSPVARGSIYLMRIKSF